MQSRNAIIPVVCGQQRESFKSRQNDSLHHLPAHQEELLLNVELGSISLDTQLRQCIWSHCWNTWTTSWLSGDMTAPKEQEVDVVVVGAGFGGCYLLHILRQQGFRVKVLEAGQTIGGVWCWNVGQCAS